MGVQTVVVGLLQEHALHHGSGDCGHLLQGRCVPDDPKVAVAPNDICPRGELDPVVSPTEEHDAHGPFSTDPEKGGLASDGAAWGGVVVRLDLDSRVAVNVDGNVAA